MALQDIIDTILKEAEEKALEIKKETEVKLQSLELEKESKLKALKAKQEASLARFKARLLQQEKFKINQELQGKILSKKRELMDSIYEKALGSLKNLDDEIYQRLVRKFLRELPEVKNAQILPSPKEGFVLKSPTLEIDCHFKTFIKEAKPKTEVEVAKILFHD